MRTESIHELRLGAQQLSPSIRRRKPSRPIHLGKFDVAPGFRWPHLLERVAANGAGIAVAFGCEHPHDLAACLLHGAEVYEVAVEIESDLFAELPARGDKRVFVSSVFPFWEGPRAVVLILPEWTTGMGQKQLDAV